MAIHTFKPVQTRDEFDERVSAHRRKLGMTKYQVWYRGQRQVSFNLAPGLLRSGDTRWQREHNLFSEFKVKAKRFLPPEQSSWETLSTMQHWGAPTRALDWTTSLDVALFFAVYGSFCFPTIWMINPYDINEKAVGKRVIFDEVDHPPYDYIDTLGGKGLPHTSPIALSVAWMNERIERQAGLFTIHGTDLAPINEQKRLKSSVRHVVIDNSLVPRLRRQLLEGGNTPDQFFPDLAGICATLKWKYELGEG